MLSMLDNDLYTFTVGQAVAELYPEAIVSYEFISRKSTPLDIRPDSFDAFCTELNNRIENMKGISLNVAEREWLAKACPYLKPSYLDYISNYRFDPRQVEIIPDRDLKNFRISIKGPWHSTIYWEVPLLALISNVYYTTVDRGWSYEGQVEKLRDKGRRLSEAGVLFADFGTRRRRSIFSQGDAVKILREYEGFTGTSNAHMAYTYGVRPIGTMSHQWLMGVSALESLRYANRFALHNWNKVYQGDLGIALPDTFGTDAFFEDFDKQLARLFDGLRHDSGDPYRFADKTVDHYKKLRIHPLSKQIVFSDGLDVDLAINTKRYCDKIGIRHAAGIGTHFTNDFQTPPLNIVIKLRTVRRNENSQEFQVVKISDVPSKATGDATALKVAKYVFFGESV